jgi:uncharacterized protein (TIGR04255 family)
VIPAKLKDDSIVEAVCQVQFSAAELPEVLVGRLSDFHDAKAYQLRRLPLADIPAPVRRADPNLRLQPLLQMVHADGRLLQIGERVLSVHVVGARKYPGWESFRAQITDMVEQLFGKVPDVSIEGLSLRYINALVKERHKVERPQGLNLRVEVAGTGFDGPINLAFLEKVPLGHEVTTRIADITFVQGVLPPGTAAIVDVEVVASGVKAKTKPEVLDWIEAAHTIEKKAFFKLLPQNVVNELVEE